MDNKIIKSNNVVRANGLTQNKPQDIKADDSMLLQILSANKSEEDPNAFQGYAFDSENSGNVADNFKEIEDLIKELNGDTPANDTEQSSKSNITRSNNRSIQYNVLVGQVAGLATQLFNVALNVRNGYRLSPQEWSMVNYAESALNGGFQTVARANGLSNGLPTVAGVNAIRTFYNAVSNPMINLAFLNTDGNSGLTPNDPFIFCLQASI